MSQSPPLLPLLLPLLLFIADGAAQKLRLGPCPDIKPVDNFNVSAYSGLWYENRNLFAIFQVGQKCVTALYSDNLGDDEVGYISVLNSGYLLTKQVDAYGYAYLTNASNVGSLAVGFPEPVDRTVANYNVIEVEYDRYSVVYSCTDVAGGTSHLELLWLLTRQAKFPEKDAQRIVRSLMKRGIYKAYEMLITDQFFCPGRGTIHAND